MDALDRPFRDVARLARETLDLFQGRVAIPDLGLVALASWEPGPREGLGHLGLG